MTIMFDILVVSCILLKAEPAVRGTQSSYAVNQPYQPYSGPASGGPTTQTGGGPRYASTAAYGGAAGTQQHGIRVGREKSSEEMHRGYQQPGVGVAPRYGSTAYAAPTGHGRSSQEMHRGYQQHGDGRYRPSTGQTPMNFDRSRGMTNSGSRSTAAETNAARSGSQHHWNNKPAPPVSQSFINEHICSQQADKKSEIFKNAIKKL